ncbi:MAG TPA: PLP-dependent aminotransferase family protein [Candidatus Baltobacteraceae bacterium]|nr:PLP-dependent aminotransferase family protein [Candidatus Baltobacteraceae bacterium]
MINRNSAIPLYQQVTAALRDAILCGDIAPGSRILSSREYQLHLGVSRNTVVEALSQLHAEGYLSTVRGVGTFVAEQAVLRAGERKGLSRAGATPAKIAEAFVEAERFAGNAHDAVPFRPGLPALDLFPSAQFKHCVRAHDWTNALLDYPDEAGYLPLREAIALRLQQTRGVRCSADQVLVTNGAQAAFALIATVLLTNGDGAIVEDPGYPDVRAILHACGARIVPIGVDEHGIDPRAFRRCRARMVYVTPSHQYPTGAVLSLERRFALLDWAARNDAWIVEDDYDSEFDYTGRPQPALQGLAGGRGVLYVGTFSKVLSPALRLAYIVVPTDVRHAFVAAHKVLGGAANTVLQSALARFMRDGHLGRHIARMRRIYDERRRFVCETLAASAPAVRVHDARAGLHLVAELPNEMSDDVVSDRARNAGIVVLPLSKYYYDKPLHKGLVMGFAATPIPQAEAAIAALAEIVTDEG